MFKIKYLQFLFAVLLPLAASAAIAAEGFEPGKRLTPEERNARIEQCRADPDKCRAEFIARREQWCKDNAERCQEIQARIEKRRAECQANPQQCQRERQARFEQRFKRVDTDGNGMLSRAEAQQAMPRLLRHFETIDANQDGQISMEELMAARKVRHEQRRLIKEPSKI